ncbi:MAG: guanylate kinase [Chloroflexota bacterium]
MAEPGVPGRLFILSGPSGVGKDAAIKRMKAHGFPMHYTVTATTRQIRPGEVDGKDYHFISQEEFDSMVENDNLLEHANVYGKRYGTPKRQVLDALAAGKDVLLKIDTQGAATVKNKIPEAIRIFLAPPSYEELKQRLIERSTESPEALQRRLLNTEAEMACAGEYDYVVCNRSAALEAAVEEIKNIILKEKARPSLASKP